MGAIQSAINRAATVGAALYTQSPGFEVKKQEKLNQAEVKKIDQQIEKLKPEEADAWGDIITPSTDKRGRPTKEEAIGRDFTKEMEYEFYNNRADLEKRKAELTGDWNIYIRTKYELAKKKAMDNTESQRKAKTDSKNTFNNFLNELRNQGVSDNYINENKNILRKKFKEEN